MHCLAWTLAYGFFADTSPQQRKYTCLCYCYLLILSLCVCTDLSGRAGCIMLFSNLSCAETGMMETTGSLHILFLMIYSIQERPFFACPCSLLKLALLMQSHLFILVVSLQSVVSFQSCVPCELASKVELTDVFFAIHGAAITLVTIYQIFIYERGNQTVSRFCTSAQRCRFLFKLLIWVMPGCILLFARFV